MSSTYAEYVAQQATDPMNDWFEGGLPLWSEAEGQASKASCAAEDARAEAARVTRLAALGHGPADAVTLDGVRYVLRDVRQDYDGQLPRFWAAKLHADGHTGDDLDDVSYASLVRAE